MFIYERLTAMPSLQIDYLQQKNADMQKQVDDVLNTSRKAASQTINLDSRNAELAKELEDVDRMAQRLQAEKDGALRTADSEISNARVGVIVCLGGLGLYTGRVILN